MEKKVILTIIFIISLLPMLLNQYGGLKGVQEITGLINLFNPIGIISVLLSPKLNVNESNQTKEEIKDEITEDKELLQDNKKSTITNDKSSQMQESVIEEVPNISNNYLSISLIGVSTIFFILTIIFSIIFTKHQLKRKKKLSKK